MLDRGTKVGLELTGIGVINQLGKCAVGRVLQDVVLERLRVGAAGRNHHHVLGLVVHGGGLGSGGDVHVGGGHVGRLEPEQLEGGKAGRHTAVHDSGRRGGDNGGEGRDPAGLHVCLTGLGGNIDKAEVLAEHIGEHLKDLGGGTGIGVHDEMVAVHKVDQIRHRHGLCLAGVASAADRGRRHIRGGSHGNFREAGKHLVGRTLDNVVIGTILGVAVPRNRGVGLTVVLLHQRPVAVVHRRVGIGGLVLDAHTAELGQVRTVGDQGNKLLVVVGAENTVFTGGLGVVIVVVGIKCVSHIFLYKIKTFFFFFFLPRRRDYIV